MRQILGNWTRPDLSGSPDETRTPGIPCLALVRHRVRSLLTMTQMQNFKYLALLKKHLVFNAATPVIAYDFEELLRFLADCEEMLKATPPLLEIPAPTVIISDIHGQYEDLHRIIDAATELAKKHRLTPRILFLGDLVDRGRASLQCYVAVMVRVMAYPRRFFVIRGNHESIKVNERYGFKEELLERYPEEKARELHKAIDRVFQWTPLSAIVAQRILCVHGGIGPSIRSIDDLKNVQRPIKNTRKANSVVNHILWSDPNPKIHMSCFNDRRNTSIFYGPGELQRVLRALKLECVIRGHQATQDGVDYPFHDRKLMTLFSAPGYCKMENTGELNNGAIVLIKPGKEGKLVFKFKSFTPQDNAYGRGADLTDEITTADGCEPSSTTNDFDNKRMDKVSLEEVPEDSEEIDQTTETMEAEAEESDFETYRPFVKERMGTKTDIHMYLS
ncbi:hypothetical protein L596_022069 [Steinernema carpocapsae]|uniref:Serine/threonine-protein phosphatase n=1 Tax=Steinernema carpocapsae TaxID=34508 RepID=A0A4U5MKN9_STECR|nr:hypothetical protein L596_022069 [Steinernema carpocapsae]